MVRTDGKLHQSSVGKRNADRLILPSVEGDATPWGRIATPEDIARAVLYLASPLGEYVTGETVFVTGGSLMAP